MHLKLFGDIKTKFPIMKSTDMNAILSQVQANSLLILDIDDTIGRVPQIIGLDAWFRFRLEQFAKEGHEPSQALARTISIYNRAQLASKTMVAVDKSIDIAGRIEELKRKNIKIIALTARNNELADKTLKLLETLGVSFSDEVLTEGSFLLNDKVVEIKKGAIFANGNNKGSCLEQVVSLGHLTSELKSFQDIHYADDSEANCFHVKASLERLRVSSFKIWHYLFAETHLTFTEHDKNRASVQEARLLEHGILLNDEEAEREMEQVRP